MNRDKDILSKYLKRPIVIENVELIMKLVRIFEDIFIKRIHELKYDNIPENEFQSYKQIITKFCKPYLNNLFDYPFHKTLNLLFHA